MDKKVVETRYVHDSWGITICCSRLLLGGVDWNEEGSPIHTVVLRRLLLGGVDWNPFNWFVNKALLVASFLEVWIEMVILIISQLWVKCRLLLGGVDWNSYVIFFISKQLLSPPSRRRGLKSFNGRYYISHRICRLLLGGVDWNIIPHFLILLHLASPPSRRCGLKF